MSELLSGRNHHHHHDECAVSPRELVRATRLFAKEKVWRSWLEVILTFTLFAAVTAGALMPLPWSIRLLFSLLSSLLMVRMFVIYHDHQHRSILNKSTLARYFMRIFGLIALTPNAIWTSSHNYHHTHNCKLKTANIGSFPIMTKEHYLTTTPQERLRYRFIRHPLTILFGYFTVFLMEMSLLSFIEKPKEHYEGLIAFLLHISIALILWGVGGWAAMLFALVLPFAIASALGTYLFYAQHNFPEVMHYSDSGWTYEGAALESSSFMTMPGILHWFTGNIGYHHIHHLNARIPFYRLPEAMRGIPELQLAKSTSLSPREMIRCLRLKVWDEQNSKMIPAPKLTPQKT